MRFEQPFMVKNGLKDLRYFGLIPAVGVIFGPANDHFYPKCYKLPQHARAVTCASYPVEIVFFYGE